MYVCPTNVIVKSVPIQQRPRLLTRIMTTFGLTSGTGGQVKSLKVCNDKKQEGGTTC